MGIPASKIDEFFIYGHYVTWLDLILHNWTLPGTLHQESRPCRKAHRKLKEWKLLAKLQCFWKLDGSNYPF